MLGSAYQVDGGGGEISSLEVKYMFLLEVLGSNHGTLPGEIGISVETSEKHS